MTVCDKDCFNDLSDLYQTLPGKIAADEKSAEQVPTPAAKFAGGLAGRKLQDVKNFIAEHYATDVRLEDLAQHAGMDAMMTSQGVSTLHIITRVFKKIPVPMTLPTTIETDAKTPRPRTSVTGLFDGSDMRVLVRHACSRVR